MHDVARSRVRQLRVPVLVDTEAYDASEEGTEGGQGDEVDDSPEPGLATVCRLALMAANVDEDKVGVCGV